MRVRVWTLIVAGCVLSACAIQPAPRIDQYLTAIAPQGGPPTGSVAMQAVAPSSNGPLDVAVLLINDRSVPTDSPALSPSGIAYVTDQLVQRLQDALPIRVARVIESPSGPERLPITAQSVAAQAQGALYVLLAVVSQVESEVPLRLPLLADPEQGGGRPGVPGFEMRTNALVELALLDAATGAVIAQADGQAWNRLNRLYVPVQSNAYPVIHRSLRVAPIYPKEEHAKDIARSLASEEAVEQAVFHLQERWARPGA